MCNKNSLTSLNDYAIDNKHTTSERGFTIYEVPVRLNIVKTKSDASLSKTKSDTTALAEEIYIPPLDVLNVRVLGLRLPDENPKKFAIKAVFYDQLLISSFITSVGHRDNAKGRTLAKGTMNYDPSDYEKMCTFADNPLTIKIQSLENIEMQILYDNTESQSGSLDEEAKLKTRPKLDIFCCNIDILSIFIGTNRLYLRQRMQPMIKPPASQAKSWDNLPLLTLEITAYRNPANLKHHKLLKEANFMKLTLIGCYNMHIPYDDEFVYTAATKMPIHNEQNCSLYTFNQGYRIPRRSNNMSFNTHWESLRLGDEHFTEGDEKFSAKLNDFQNEENLDLEYYVDRAPEFYKAIWKSFHKTLLLKSTEKWLSYHLRRYKWPFELHLYGDNNCGYSFVGFLDLFRLLYPGETTARIAVPLHWVNSELILEKCGCEFLLPSNEKSPSSYVTVQKSSKATTESIQTSTNTSTSKTIGPRPTGSDENPSFLLIEVKLARPFKEAVIPPLIPQSDINDMLSAFETIPSKRESSGRGQTDSNWLSTVRSANTSLRRVPYFGITDICLINRQLGGTRTRLEILTSFWQEAAIYVNNNFVLDNFLDSNDTFEEMTLMAHACLMRMTTDYLMNKGFQQEIDPTLRAARHARQLKDANHAADLYHQTVVKAPRDADLWRELSTCMKDIDVDAANVCINKSIILNPRHPLSLLSKGCMIFDSDPDAAEPFFVSLLSLYPFWTVLWVAASAYYWHRELFHMSTEIMCYVKKMHAEGLAAELPYPRAWEKELGDWWDQTPLLPGTSRYYDAADLLLRIRAISLAEVCLARALTEIGESPVYYHLLGLCTRLRKDVDTTLCHLHSAVEKFGDIFYLRSLEGECYHRKKDFPKSKISFEKAGGCLGAYSILLSLPRREAHRIRAMLTDLIRRQPSAYAWLALADDWMMRSVVGEGGDAGATDEQATAISCGIACAVQALKLDRQAGRAWALLANTVKPSARRLHCENMATFEPGPPPSWSGTFYATNGNIRCNQILQVLNIAVGREDCLVVNIFTPQRKNSHDLIPVMVFIHGGGFQYGSNTILLYDAQYLAQKNIIVVTINYRLGLFGFLCLNKTEAPGNMGLRDQVAALQWINGNIESFGGDPHSVTLVGESAGALSVQYLVMSELTKGLFKRCIMESGSILVPVGFDENPIDSARAFTSRLGYNTTDVDEILDILQNADAFELTMATLVNVKNDIRKPYTFPPCAEDPKTSPKPFLTTSPRELLRRFKVDPNLNLVMGFNNKEGLMFAGKFDSDSLRDIDHHLNKILPSNLIFKNKGDRARVIRDIKEIYFANTGANYNGLINYLSDSIIIYPSIEVIEHFLKGNATVYNYVFMYDSLRNLNKFISGLPFTPGANHGDELFYIFDPLPLKLLPFLENDRRVVEFMTNAWTNFTKTGIPSAPGVEWLKSEKNNLRFLSIGNDRHMTSIPYKERMQLWKNIYQKYGSY
ncbi:unnamed protein product [Leptosia nina]|uniref:Carboxylesterase type B domain-containing protein n=1 Tax=Leptosia nina TaxID=320188 RepID=A0AAV1IU10_9NEOP